jgi:hypothetical protein
LRSRPTRTAKLSSSLSIDESEIREYGPSLTPAISRTAASRHGILDSTREGSDE